jgi:integrase
VDLFLASKKDQGLKARSLQQLTYRLKKLRESLGGSTGLRSITSFQLSRFLRFPSWTPATRRNYWIDLGTFFNWAGAAGLQGSSPMKGIGKPLLDDVAPVILTTDQARSLLDAAKDYGLAWFVAIGLFSGLRTEEIKTLEAAQIKQLHIEVRADRSKSRRRRLVEILPLLRAWLDAYPPQLPLVGYQHKWEGLTWAAGLRPWPQNAMRHSFASYYLTFSGSSDQTALMLGHRSTETLFRHYRELVSSGDAQHYWLLSP